MAKGTQKETEIGNNDASPVSFQEILESKEWKESNAGIPLILGKDEQSTPLIADLSQAHLLLGGATGSGKTVCLHSIIASLLSRFSPDELRILMIDPVKQDTELYEPISHLLAPAITDPLTSATALVWAIKETDRRFQLFADARLRNIEEYNKSFTSSDPSGKYLPRVVIIISELTDLMILAKQDVENYIARLAQMSKATGIHLIVSSQRQSRSIVTGIVKANIQGRIAFQVPTWRESKNILEVKGAEALSGKGDMLYRQDGSSEPIHAQGAFISHADLQSIIQETKLTKPPTQISFERKESTMATAKSSTSQPTEEELIKQCLEIITTTQKASVSLLQRRLRLSYSKAGAIMDILEARGIIGPSKGAEPREILIDTKSTSGE